MLMANAILNFHFDFLHPSLIYFPFLRALYHPWKQLRVKSRKSNIRQLSREVAAKEKKRTHVPSAICWLFYFPSYYLRSSTCCFFQQYDAYFLSCLHSCESLIYLSPSGDSGHLKKIEWFHTWYSWKYGLNRQKMRYWGKITIYSTLIWDPKTSDTSCLRWGVYLCRVQMQNVWEQKEYKRTLFVVEGVVVVINLPVFHAGWLGYMALSIT